MSSTCISLSTLSSWHYCYVHFMQEITRAQSLNLSRVIQTLWVELGFNLEGLIPESTILIIQVYCILIIQVTPLSSTVFQVHSPFPGNIIYDHSFKYFLFDFQNDDSSSHQLPMLQSHMLSHGCSLSTLKSVCPKRSLPSFLSFVFLILTNIHLNNHGVMLAIIKRCQLLHVHISTCTLTNTILSRVFNMLHINFQNRLLVYLQALFSLKQFYKMPFRVTFF